MTSLIDSMFLYPHFSVYLFRKTAAYVSFTGHGSGSIPSSAVSFLSKKGVKTLFTSGVGSVNGQGISVQRINAASTKVSYLHLSYTLLVLKLFSYLLARMSLLEVAVVFRQSSFLTDSSLTIPK